MMECVAVIVKEDKENVGKLCSCAEWVQNYRQLENMIMLGFVHGIKYTGTFFKFCPWCGEKLEFSNKSVNIV